MRKLVVIGMLLLAACGGGGDDAPTTPDPGAPPAPAESEPALPTADCGAGTRAALGSSTCVPVGPAACAPGFVAHASGYGCVPVMPDKACTGATRDALGQTSCVPVGDCNAAFPPAGAMIVDASLAAEDATHKKTIAAAMAAATDGATIAVADGTYAENLVVDRPLTIVGRCAEKVILEAGATAAGFTVHLAPLTLRGMTIHGGVRGVDVYAQKFTASEVVFEGNGINAVSLFKVASATIDKSVLRGSTAGSPGNPTAVFGDISSKVTMTDSAISDAAQGGFALTGETTLSLSRSIVRDVKGPGIRLFQGSTATIEESAIVNAQVFGVDIGNGTKGSELTSMTMKRSSIVGTQVVQGTVSQAIVEQGARLEAEDSTFADGFVIAIGVDKPKSIAKLTRSAVVNTTSSADASSYLVFTVNAANGGTIELDNSVVARSEANAVYASETGSLVKLVDSLVTETTVGTRGSTKGEGFAVAAVDGGSVELTGSTVDKTHGVALLAGSKGSRMDVSRSYIRGTLADGRAELGHGIVGEIDATLNVDACYVADNASVGIAYDDGQGVVSHTFVKRNAVGIQVQGSSSLVEVDAAPSELPARTVFVTTDSQFVGNGTQVGAGEVPLPNVLEPGTP